ncbi:hypothetical protein EDD17DRAFT_1892743 [Pisolithus thermaeus]|nr:hypothetical protein EV401DRAFT_1886930 [Pisolithus croceorrhizus]KAI6167921.1 hypothetical protein EDD17DRAFT_1892743 [Pisolithus thermaeus]
MSAKICCLASAEPGCSACRMRFSSDADPTLLRRDHLDKKRLVHGFTWFSRSRHSAKPSQQGGEIVFLERRQGSRGRRHCSVGNFPSQRPSLSYDNLVTTMWRMILGEFLALGASGKNGQGVSSRSWPGVIRGRDGWYGSSCSCVLSNWKAGGTSSSEKEHTARGSPTQSGLLNGGFVGYESSNLDMVGIRRVSSLP